MASECRHQLTKKAETDLSEILDYMVNELCDPISAGHFMDKLSASFKEAQAFPNSGTPVNNPYLPDKGLRKKRVGNYLYYYLTDTENRIIIILRIVHGSRNLNEILRNLR